MRWRKVANIVILAAGLFLIAGCGYEIFTPLPVGVTGSWHGELIIQAEKDNAEPLTVGLDLSLTQTESPGAITGHINIAMPSFYLSLNIKQGRAEENGSISFTATGTAGDLPDSPVFTFQFTGTRTTSDRMDGKGTYSVGKASHSFTWWAERGEPEGISRKLKGLF